MVQRTMKPIHLYRHHDRILHVTFSGLVFTIVIMSFDKIKISLDDRSEILLELWCLYLPEVNVSKSERINEHNQLMKIC